MRTKTAYAYSEVNKMPLFEKCPRYQQLRLPTIKECKSCRYYKEQYTDEEANLLRVTCELSEYINFGNLCRNELGIQSQYGYHYITGIGGSPNLSEGIRLKGGNNHDYHSLYIHKDDADTFKNRVMNYRKPEMQ
jgi:hypothetical protein